MTAQPGDLCQFVKDEKTGRWLVRHVQCDQFTDGVVTDLLTQKVVRREVVAS